MRVVRQSVVVACLVAAVLPTRAATPPPWEGAPFSWSAKEGRAALEKLSPREKPPAAPTTEEVKEDEEGEPELTSEDIDLLYEDQKTVFDAEARRTDTIRWVYWVKTPNGARAWARVSAHWRAYYQDRPVIRARVITAEGDVHELDPNTLSVAGADDENDDEYTGASALQGPLPAIAAGALVEEETVYREHTPFFRAGVVIDRWFRQGSRSPRHLTAHVEVPASLPMQVKAKGPAPEFRKGKTGTMQTIDIDTGALPAAKPYESFTPPGENPAPVLRYTVGGTWRDVATAYNVIVEKQLAGEVAPQLKSWRGSASGREAIASKLLASLHKTVRYTALELGTAALTPTQPKEVLQRKYGDCKDMATMMVAGLRDAGIPAQVALLQAGYGSDIDPSLPGMTFNHAIVYVPGKPALWIDPTDPDLGVGELPFPDQGRLALIVSPDTRELTKTPTSDAHANRTSLMQEIALAASGPAARISQTREEWGAPASGSRAGSRDQDPRELRKSLEKALKEDYSAEKLTKFEMTAADDVDHPYRLFWEVSNARRGFTGDDVAEAWIYPRHLLDELPRPLTELPKEDHEEPARTNDFWFAMPVEASVQYRLVPPAGYEPESLPDVPLPSFAPFKVTRDVQTEASGAVVITYRLATQTQRLTPAEYASVRAAVREFSSEGVKISFGSIPARLAREGKIREAADLYRSSIAANPKEPVYLLRLARLWLSAGAGKAARDAAEAAIKLDPTFDKAHATLGDVLAHDVMGRPFGSGYDRVGSIAAWKEAVRLKPDDEDNWFGLITALERGTDGNVFGAGAPMDELAAAYTTMREKTKATKYDQSYLTTLLRLGRIKAMTELKPPPAKDCKACEVLLLCGRALTQGPKSVVAETHRLRPESEKQRALLQQVGVTLAQVREYPLGAEVLQASLDMAPTPNPQFEAFTRLVKRSVRIEKVTSGNKTPVDVALMAFRSFFTPSFDANRLKEMYAKEALDTWGDEETIKSETSTTGHALKTLFGAASDILNMEDVVTQQLGTQVNGSDDVGYRINFNPLEQNSAGQAMSMYVVKQGDSYRVMATDSGLYLVGVHVLALIDAHKEEAARQWLDWMLEAAPARANPAFLDAWTVQGDRSSERMRRAAALLMLRSPARKKAVAILETAALPEGREQRSDFTRILALAEVREKKYDVALARITAALKEEPSNDSLFITRDIALRGMKRSDEANALAEKRLLERPHDELALRSLVRGALEAVQWEKALKLQLDIAEHEQNRMDQGSAYNDLSWYAVASGSTDPIAVTWAEKSNELTYRNRPSVLHTLATAYILFGRPVPGLAALVQSVNAGSGEIERYHWFTLGLLYEKYGLTDDAVAAYGKAKREDGDTGPEVTSAAFMAAKRLAALKPSR